MPRRETVNRTGIRRIEGINPHDVWVSYVCLKCSQHNCIKLGSKIFDTDEAYNSAKWVCCKCGFVHCKESDLPFPNETWAPEYLPAKSLAAQRFWQAFFRTATEHLESYWKQCTACGRVLPFSDFSKHSNFGLLRLQMECRCCKGAINAKLNPCRTKEQLHESSVRRRIGDLLLKGQSKKISPTEIFKIFGGKCFKTGKILDINDRSSWHIDHILPSSYLYPLSLSNAALLCKEANGNKRAKWPNEFYSNSELVRLSQITGANLHLLTSPTPIPNPDIDVNACVTRFLTVREHSDLGKRIQDLKKMLVEYNLVARLSAENKKILGFD